MLSHAHATTADACLRAAMSLVSGLSHRPAAHHHEGHRYSLHAAGGCHENAGAAPYFPGWLIKHADMCPTEYSRASGYSPDYHDNSGSGSTCSPDPPHPPPFVARASVRGTGARSVSAVTVGIRERDQHAHRRSGKRRPAANRKERRRTQSINAAFAELRDCIPHVPADTKLSKIKTLRLATSYISYLMDVLEKDGRHGETQPFQAELEDKEVREGRRSADAVRAPKDPVGRTEKSKSFSNYEQFRFYLYSKNTFGESWKEFETLGCTDRDKNGTRPEMLQTTKKNLYICINISI